MSIHEKNIEKSIDANIIGTANIVKACKRKKITGLLNQKIYRVKCPRGKDLLQDGML